MRKRRKNLFPFVQIFVVLLFLMSIPLAASLNLKGIAVAALAPLWELISSISTSFRHVSDVKVTHEDGTEKYAQEEIDRLKLENQLLANEVLNLTDILKNEALIALQVLDKDSDTLSQRIDMLQLLREQDFSRLLSLQLSSIPAQVIFRSPGSWTNSFWVNVGAADNDSLQNDVIVKNSPVVVGTSIAGVIDYVGKHQSRVRMITDSGLCCSVRVMRIVDKQAKYLAKGELRGSVEAVWRGLSPVLRGVGFNYDYADEDGPSRDLRTGEVLGAPGKFQKMQIIQPKDLLITSGMDGVFPRGLQVATVSKIHQLAEGDYCYEIEAIACIKNLDDLSTVYILPPLGYDPNNQAPHLLR